MDRDRDEIEDLATLADALLEQATEMRRQWTELADAVGLEAAGPAPAANGRRRRDPDAERMRMVALDMVLSGSSREEVTEHLQRTFGARDVGPVVQEVFAQYGEQ